MNKININDPKYWQNIDWDEPEQPALLKKTDADINREIGIRNYYATVSDEELQARGQNISKAKKGKESNHKGKTRPWAGKKRDKPGWNKGQPAVNRGIPMSEESKAKISAKKKGQPAPNKGIPMSEEAKDKMRLSKNAQACKTPYGLFQYFSTFYDYCIQENIFPNRKISNLKNFLRFQFTQHIEGYEYISREEYIRLTGKQS